MTKAQLEEATELSNKINQLQKIIKIANLKNASG